MVTVVEGFDCVGKTTWLNKQDGIRLGSPSAQFGYTSMEGEYGIGYPQSWIVGASWFYLLNKLGNTDNIFIDRGILSILVYGEIQENFRASEYVLSKLIEDMKAIGSRVVYLKHANKESATQKFMQSRTSTDRHHKADDEYDMFTGAEEYWARYLDMDARFMGWIEVIRAKGLEVEVIELDISGECNG